MQTVFRIVSEPAGLIRLDQTPVYTYSQKQAEEANLAFDLAVRTFLRNWIDQGTISGFHADTDADAFIEQGALRSFFQHHDDALEQLLRNDAIARHLLRSVHEVHFQTDAYEPLLAQFERRIYNVAAHREHREVPFRYSPPSRQSDYGDTVDTSHLPADQVREDIGMYFGTRRSDTTALTILGDQLRREALAPASLPIHVVTEGYMDESLRAVRVAAEQAGLDDDDRLHIFIIQRRHAADDRHLGAALLVMNPQQPDRPCRLVFCDTLNPSGTPPWWDKFKQKVDVVFPVPAGEAPVSTRLEDGSVNLQRLHDGVPVRHQDIDCAFYTASIGRALIQLAQIEPTLILSGSIEAVREAMTARMPEYFDQPGQPKAPVAVREENIARRWNTGREALCRLLPAMITVPTRFIDFAAAPAVSAELA
ncbi:hypothetical protein GGR92_003604 [Spirosoma lacussanchae]|uniref:hypothetical protein n=1 Tax=Spirosoma lacussanchae TaxID=1884249 RepID=UPI001BB14BA6|nr:hypothetical protein [Spirosoma lacussanchae]